MLKKSFSRRQETGDRKQETGRTGNERGGRSKNCKSDFSTIVSPKY
ncbi:MULTISPECIES: hypothetical protein [Okeania]|nr:MULTISPECIES: hypothetical protein [Okeania]NES75944.1 hypothetical protein [Okeania sp. SIO1H4]NET18905.1 hypothetical protein [Okeania sp. SIO1H5]NET76400.1 hypothetical protein [Okeania sp. SIO1F9]NET93386.1 hypothetical protein [Okeania sp. SIO1H2]